MQNRNYKVRIQRNILQGSEYLKTVNIGLVEGAWVQLLGYSLNHDYMMIQIHSKVFALPINIVDGLEFSE